MSYTKTTWVNNTTPINETNLNKIESGIKNNDINIGEENYDNTRTYEVGDIVRYNEKIYKCITAITTAENFDISKWEQTNIVEIVQSEKSKIYELIEALSTPIVGEGENITLNDTAEKRFENFDIEGNSEQEASPSPDYPSEVKSCGDNINLFDKNDITNNTSIDVRNGNTYTDNNSFSTNFIKINGITELCCNGLSDTSKLWGAIYDENKSFIKGINTTNGIFNETNLSGATYIRLGLLKTYLDSCKLEKGSTPSPFSPYGQGCINEVICNKNLFDKNTTTDNTALNLSDGSSVTFNGRSTSDYIIVKYNTKYVFSKDGEKLKVNIVEYDKNKNFIKGYTGDAFTTSNDTRYIKFYFGTADMGKIQLEQDVIVTSYEEHQEQSYIMPVQQEMLEGDYFDWDNEEEVHTWGKYEFTGEEAFSIALNSNYYVIYTQGDFINNFDYNETVETYKCSHFKSIAINTRYQNNTFFININRNLTFTTLKYSTVTDFKTWLKSLYDAGTPVTVYYKLATPERLKFTNEQKAVAKKLNNAKTYKGVTHIYSNDAVSPNCYVEAVKDLTTLIQ